MRPEPGEHRGGFSLAAELWPPARGQFAQALAQAGIPRMMHVSKSQPTQQIELIARRTDLPSILGSGAGQLAWPGGVLLWTDATIEWTVADPSLHRAFEAISASGSR